MTRTEWQPIETAPKEPYKHVDLWVVRPNGSGFREANGYCSGNGKHWLSNTGHYLEGRRYYEDGDHCIDVDYRGPDGYRVTHWMPLPPAP